MSEAQSQSRAVPPLIPREDAQRIVDERTFNVDVFRAISIESAREVLGAERLARLLNDPIRRIGPGPQVLYPWNVVDYLSNENPRKGGSSSNSANLQSSRPGIPLSEAHTARFYSGSYADNHWALEPCRLDDPKMIALGRYGELQYATYINPTDSRGYRCIARLINNSDMHATLNREFSPDEHFGLALITDLVEQTMRTITPLAQSFKLGNNSHQFDPKKQTIQIGHEHEPCFLHSHILGRGNPSVEYIPGVRLGGPPPGIIFDIGGKGASADEQQLTPWREGDIIYVALHLKSALKQVVAQRPSQFEFEF